MPRSRLAGRVHNVAVAEPCDRGDHQGPDVESAQGTGRRALFGVHTAVPLPAPEYGRAAELAHYAMPG